MWSQLAARISYFFRKLIRQPKNVAGEVSDAPKEVDRDFESARMTNNRLQALDGAGYRQCYMEKLREVANDAEKPEANREYWFGKEEVPPLDGKSAKNDGSISSSKLPRIRETIPSQARITTTRLQAYVESLPKPEE